jgi:hypothetical protein
MHSAIVAFILAIALIAACDTGGSSKQGPSTKRGDLAPTAVSGCESLDGQARDDCVRMTREGGTATPARPTNPGETPTTAAATGGAARAERGSGREG